MALGNIYFILVRPQMGENIGSVARAIKNFNIKQKLINAFWKPHKKYIPQYTYGVVVRFFNKA